MPKGFDITKPIYPQIIEHIKTLLINGQYVAGEKIPSVRDLALEFEVNPNTVQKALTELEREGLLKSERTLGRFVTDDVEKIESLKSDLPDSIIRKFVDDMEYHGIKPEEIIKYVSDYLGKDVK